MISKFKNSQLVFIDGVTPARIRRVFKQENTFQYEIRETGKRIPEERLSLLKQ